MVFRCQYSQHWGHRKAAFQALDSQANVNRRILSTIEYALDEDGIDVSEKLIANFEGIIIVEFR
ncbi:MAG: hypothetical protein ACW96N_08765, partial [Candidatus Thorarchaeota archaeon]